MLLRGHERLWAHTKTGHGSQRKAQHSFNITSLFDYWQLCNENGLWNQWTCVTQRERSLDETELKWLQLPPPPFSVLLSLFLQLCVCFCSLMDVFHISGKDGQRCLLHFSQFTLLLPVSFPSTCLPDWQVKLSSQTAAHPALFITSSKKWNE
jgi:hypothetical protein